MRARITIRDILHYFGIVQDEGNVCPICEEVIEDCRLLFLHCNRIYKVWAMVASLWGMNVYGVW